MKTTIEELNGKLIATLEGEMDTAAAIEAEKVLQPLYKSDGREVVIECEGLEYIASSGLRILLGILKGARAGGSRVVMRHVNDDIKNVFSLTGFINYQRAKQTTCIMRYFEPSVEKLHKTGVAVVDEQDRIISMEEKPHEPKSHWCTPPFYIYKASDAGLVKVGIESGCGVDAPGSFIAWLSSVTPVHAYEMPGKRYDIGNLQSYEDVKNSYRGIER